MAEIPRGGGSTVKLHDITDTPGMWWLPYELLKERTPGQNISHKAMPEWDDHFRFMSSRPYAAWYWFDNEGEGTPAGCVYLTHQREIGVGVLKCQRGQGLAREAITELMRLHPGRFLANINPANEASIALFRSLGFGGPIQLTLERQA